MNAVASTYTESIAHSPSISRWATAVKSPGLTKAEDTFLTRLKRGDEGAFDELVNQHHSALIRMASAPSSVEPRPRKSRAAMVAIAPIVASSGSVAKTVLSPRL